jgi:tripartite-type tricarboxylate transporter receptor subunit TctC
MTMLRKSWILPLATALVAAGLAAAPASAQQGADFYNGQTVTYIVATDPGGGYDTYGRLIAEYMQKHLPGSTFVVQNMPGAGHIIGANAIFASEPDGLTIGTFNTGLIYNQLIGLESVKFDFTKMSWIGKAASEPRVIVVSKESGIESYEQLKSLPQRVKFGTAGVGSASYVETTMLTSALELPIDIVTGYNGNEDQLAMRRGEIQGIVASRSTYEQFVKEGNGRFIGQIGGTQTDVPQLSTFATEGTGAQVVALITSQSTISRLTAGPPGIPQDRLDALREAYKKATSDPEFVDRAQKLELPIDPVTGDELLTAVQAALNQTPETVELIRNALKKD